MGTSLIRTLSEWCVGPRLWEQTLKTWDHFTQAREIGNEALHGRHAGETRCFIIGNGPSLGQLDLKPLAEEYTIGANSFYKHPDAATVGLDYLCIFDEHFMKDEPRAVEWHHTIATKLPTARLVLHEKAKPLVAKHGLYGGREVYFVRPGRGTHDAEAICLDFTRPRNVGMTTGSTVAIPLAMALGFKEICLIGFDCNWLSDTTASYHFYASHDQYPEFDSVSKDNRGFSYEGELRTALREFESHRLLRTRAEKMGIRIVNATRGGLLDTYDRVPYEDLLRSGASRS